MAHLHAGRRNEQRPVARVGKKECIVTLANSKLRLSHMSLVAHLRKTINERAAIDGPQRRAGVCVEGMERACP